MIGRCQNFEEVNMSTLPVKLLAQNTQFQGHVLLASFVWNAPTQKGQQKLVQLKLRFNLQVCVRSRWPLPNFSGEKFESGRVFFFFSDGSDGATGWYSILYIYIYIFIFHLLTTSCSFTFALHLFIIFQSVMFAIWKHPDTTGTSKAVGGTDQL